MWTKTSGHTKNVNRTPVKKKTFPLSNRDELVWNLCLSYSLTNGIIHVLILKLIRLVIKFKCLTTEISFPAASRNVSQGETANENLENEEQVLMYVKRAIYDCFIKLASIAACTT